MKISVITATYNSGATLRDNMESMLSQSYGNFEHIIVDGLSKDDTLDIVNEYLPRYEGRLKVVSEKDNGIYDAMNKGIKMASGEIIGILNSDDFYSTPDILSTVAKEIAEVDAVYGDLDFVDSIETTKVIRQWRGSQYTQGAFLRGWHPAHPTFYVRKECYSNLGSFDTSFAVSADFELMLRFLEKGQISSRYIPKTLVKMRMGGESTGSLRKILQGNKNVLRAFRKNGFDISPFYIVRRLVPKAINLFRNKLHI